LLARTANPDRVAKLEGELAGPDLPDGCEYLIGWLYDVGPALPGAMGFVPLTYSELRAWSELQQISISPWEAGTLRELSAAYCAVISATRSSVTVT
jgi:hypothetical protein